MKNIQQYYTHNLIDKINNNNLTKVSILILICLFVQAGTHKQKEHFILFYYLFLCVPLPEIQNSKQTTKKYQYFIDQSIIHFILVSLQAGDIDVSKENWFSH